jgi:hypothetical protein
VDAAAARAALGRDRAVVADNRADELQGAGVRHPAATGDAEAALDLVPLDEHVGEPEATGVGDASAARRRSVFHASAAERQPTHLDHARRPDRQQPKAVLGVGRAGDAQQAATGPANRDLRVQVRQLRAQHDRAGHV